jgi:hypothetical protein
MTRRAGRGFAARLGRDERGQSLPIVLALVTLFFLLGSALAVQASVSLRATVANERQAGNFHAADGGAELGIWWHRNANPGNPPDVTLNGATVSTTVSATAPTCDSATPAYLTGFEHGAASAAGGGLFTTMTGAGATADATTARSGNYSLRIVDAALVANNVGWSVAGNVLVARFGIRFPALPLGNVAELAVVDTAAGNDLRLGYDQAAQRLTLRFGAGAAVSSTVEVSAGAWQRVELRATVNANPRTADWRIDGLAQTALSSAGAGSTVTSVLLGSTVPADVYTANYDDVVLSTTSADYPIGDGSVFALGPNANGTHSNPVDFQHEDGTALGPGTYQRLDEVPMTSTLDAIHQKTTDTTGYVEIDVANTAQTCLIGVDGIMAYSASGAGARNGKASVFDGATERVIYNGDMTVAALSYRSTIVTPAAGSWTTAAVNGLKFRFGYSSDANPDPIWDALLLEVGTGPSTPGTVTVTSTAGSSTVTTTYPDSGAAAPTLATWTATR